VTIAPIKARSRKPIKLPVSLSSNCRASAAVSTGVLPRLIMGFGPRTEGARLKGTMPPLVGQSRSKPIAAGCGTSQREPYHLRGQQFAAFNFAFERARNAAMRMDFQITRQMLIAKVYPIWCYEECVARHLARPLSSAT
jgi:hypothetical protein